MTPEDILSFWFDPTPNSAADVGQAIRRWFGASPELDQEIRDRFGSTVERALAGELDEWAKQPRGALALVIVLDQFTRHCFRGSARAFAGDAAAQRFAQLAVDRGDLAQLNAWERPFLGMPLGHSEQVALQQLNARLIEEWSPQAPELARTFVEAGKEQSAKYLSIIERFGRFPHRNHLLGRTSTKEELEFLSDWQEQGPPRAARELGLVART